MMTIWLMHQVKVFHCCTRSTPWNRHLYIWLPMRCRKKKCSFKWAILPRASKLAKWPGHCWHSSLEMSLLLSEWGCFGHIICLNGKYQLVSLYGRTAFPVFKTMAGSQTAPMTIYKYSLYSPWDGIVPVFFLFFFSASFKATCWVMKLTKEYYQQHELMTLNTFHHNDLYAGRWSGQELDRTNRLSKQNQVKWLIRSFGKHGNHQKSSIPSDQLN